MKNYIFFKAAGLAFLLCGGQAGESQSLVSSSPPIVIELSDIDRSHVYVHSPKEPLGQWRLGILMRELPQPKVDELVRSGLLMHSPVWVIDGQKVFLKLPPLVGEAVWGRRDGKDKEEFGPLLGFSSQDEAEKAAKVLRLEPTPLMRRLMEGQ
jgi:hypothetical protein